MKRFIFLTLIIFVTALFISCTLEPQLLKPLDVKNEALSNQETHQNGTENCEVDSLKVFGVKDVYGVDIIKEITDTESELSDDYASPGLMDSKVLYSTTYFRWPVKSYVYMSSCYDHKRGTGYHKGMDLASYSGTPIYASASGKVTVSKYSSSYGNWIEIRHNGKYNGKTITTRYAHMKTRWVSLGKTVKAGQQIGTVGSTGNSTGPHLHYEVRLNGIPSNPAPFLKAPGKVKVSKYAAACCRRFAKSLEKAKGPSQIPPPTLKISDKFKCTASVLNMRNIPSTSGSTIVSTIKKNEIVTAIERGKYATIGGLKSYWYKVRKSNNKIGWAFGGYLKKLIRKRVIANPSLRLRKSSSTASAVIGQLKYQSYVYIISSGKSQTIAGKKGQWVNVMTQAGMRGWCFDAYLK